jgi:Zn-dependent peptidase ImmA (M78 family)
VYDPWADLAGRPDIEYGSRDLGEAQGLWIDKLRVVLVHDGLTKVQARCALAHVLAHVDRDDVRPPRGDFGARIRRRQERNADQLAASRLISDQQLADVAGHDVGEWASLLQVTVPVMRTRIVMQRDGYNPAVALAAAATATVISMSSGIIIAGMKVVELLADM